MHKCRVACFFDSQCTYFHFQLLKAFCSAQCINIKQLSLLLISHYHNNAVDDINFPMAILACFFSHCRIVSNQRYCHIRQTICSTRFGVRVCLLVLWSNNFQPPFHRLPKFKISHCKMRFFVKITDLLYS